MLTTTTNPGSVDGGVCDALYAELQVVCRRVLRVRDLATEAGVDGAAPRLGRAVEDLLRTALEALGAVPDVPVEAGPRVPVLIRVGDLVVWPAARRVSVCGVDVRVVGKAFDLLVRLAREPGVVVSKTQLLRDVWGLPAGVGSRTVDSHASRLRCALTASGVQGEWVVNHWGVGYSLTTPTQ